MVKKNETLVTGACGFIAFHLIEKLLREGQAVVGIDNWDSFYSKDLKERNLRDLRKIALKTGTSFTFQKKDIRNLNPNSLITHSVTEVVHLAAKAGVRPSLENPVAYGDVNIQGTLKVLEFCHQRKINQLLFGSSSSVYGNDTHPPFREDSTAVQPISPYAATKRAGELLCSTYSHLYGMRIASLRFFTVYGPRQRPDLAIRKFTDKIANHQTITLFGNGETSRDYTYVTDIVDGITSALDWLRSGQSAQHEIFNLGGSKTTPLVDLVRMIESELGHTAKIEWKPKQPGDVEITFADVSKSAKALGYSPQVPIREGIRRFVQWYREG